MSTEHERTTSMIHEANERGDYPTATFIRVHNGTCDGETLPPGTVLLRDMGLDPAREPVYLSVYAEDPFNLDLTYPEDSIESWEDMSLVPTEFLSDIKEAFVRYEDDRITGEVFQVAVSNTIYYLLKEIS